MGQRVCTLANNQAFSNIGCSAFNLNKYIRKMCVMDYKALGEEMIEMLPVVSMINRPNQVSKHFKYSIYSE